MIDMIVNYWLEFLLGLISSGLIALCTYLYKLYKNEKKRKRSASDDRIINEVKTIVQDHDRDIMKLIQKEELASQKADSVAEEKMRQIQANLTILTEGMLSIQGKQFKDECRALLADGHHITLAEYENASNEHRIYNSLKGNHEGDELFRLVGVKYHSEISK